jgi:hypothetical protein
MQPLVFGRTGWLEHYDTTHLDEGAPRFGGSFNVDDVGSEVDNFRRIRGYYYGYIQTGADALGFNAERVASMEGVLVVLCAKSPSLGQVVVGWYNSATLYDEHRELRGRYGLYNFRARAEDAVLLPSNRRTWEVPTGSKALGQSNVFYGLTADGRPRRDRWIRDIVRRIENYDPSAAAKEAIMAAEEVTLVEAVHAAGQGIGLSAADRVAVEQHAMTAAENYYRKEGYETQVRGRPFDLLCLRGDEELRVEVKGTTGTGESVLVTIGEVKSARAHATELFVLSEIKLTPKGPKGGRMTIVAPWKPTFAQLQPKLYKYTLPDKTSR